MRRERSSRTREREDAAFSRVAQNSPDCRPSRAILWPEWRSATKTIDSIIWKIEAEFGISYIFDLVFQNFTNVIVMQTAIFQILKHDIHFDKKICFTFYNKHSVVGRMGWSVEKCKFIFLPLASVVRE